MIGIIAAGFLVAVIIAFQLSFFKSTKEEINRLKKFFPSQDNLWLVYSTLSKSILRDREKLKDFVEYPPIEKEPRDMKEDDVNVALVKAKGGSDSFKQMIKETNEYLCKNAGTAADLAVLEDICDKKISSLENSIKTTLNTPLYFGLGGTFIGIIVGVWVFAFDLGSVFEMSDGHGKMISDLSGLYSLLIGIGIAMLASFMGLAFTVTNTAFNYKKAQSLLDEKESDYVDFLRRELMPTLSNSMTASLNSLKGVLGHFVDKFGKNLSNYADSAHLLNENLVKQQKVLDQIQSLGVTQMAKTISTSFADLKEAADSLMVFRRYQIGLNETMEKVTYGVANMDLLISRFEEFIKTLKTIASSQVDTNRLQKEFKEAIEQHFPTGSEGREIWRKEFDLLVNDAQEASGKLNEHLTANTKYVHKFIQDNERFFSSFDELNAVVFSLVDYARIQGECYKDLKTEMNEMRKEALEIQKSNAELQKSVLQALQAMTKAIKDKKI